MTGKTRYFENLLLNHLFRGATMTLPASWYIGLFTVAPTDTTAGTESTLDRVEMPRDTDTWTESINGNLKNAVICQFGVATDDETIVAFGFFDAPTGGNLWLAELLEEGDELEVLIGQEPQFIVSQITIAEE